MINLSSLSIQYARGLQRRHSDVEWTHAPCKIKFDLFDRQGLLKIRGEVKKSDAVATLLATKAIQNQLVEAWSHC